MIQKICLMALLAVGIGAMPQAPRNPPPPAPPQSLQTSPFNPNQGRRDNFGRNYNNVPIIRSENDNTGDGNYKWAYETGDQQTAQAEGRFAKAYPGLTGPNADETALEVTGSWSYVEDADGTGKAGRRVLVEYTAGVNGYRERRTYQ